MQLARFLNSVFKKDGFILVDANSKNYIIGNPKNDNPIKLKILNKKLHYKLLFHPDLYFGEALRTPLRTSTMARDHLWRYGQRATTLSGASS